MNFAPYEYHDLSEYDRVIAVSDIHGDYDGFLKLLDETAFSERDGLIIVGDILEKGEKCLPLLRLIYEMQKKGNVLMVAGNNDRAFSIWRSGAASDEDMLRYALHTDRSILFEMSEELGIGCRTMEELKRLKTAIYAGYSELIRWLGSLPFIIETDFAVFVHAGLRPGPLTEQDPRYCLSAPGFGRENHRWAKLVVVGHWPVSNYSRRVITISPYYNPAANTISIDGGASLKSWGQLNYLVFRPGEAGYTAGSADTLPKIRLLDAQEANDPVTLIFPDTRLEKRENGRYFVPHIEKELDIPPESVYDYRGTLYAADFTTYTLPVKPGDTASLCEKAGSGVLIKRGGEVGWYYGSWEQIRN